MAQINKPNEYFNTNLWTGNGTTATGITGVGFQPDMTWIKERSQIRSHVLFDVIRGATVQLNPNDTASDATVAESLQSFDSDGFTVGNATSVNQSGETYVGWNWLAGGTASSNTDGSITSNVSASTTSGFSIVKWTSTDTAGSTIGHGLGSIPKMIITKKITSGNPGNWTVYHNSLGNTKSIALNTTGAEDTATSYWNDTSPTSSVFSTGTYFDVGDYIAYCFAEKKGFSKAFSYTGNGSTDGTFVYTGFKPAFTIIKQSSASGQNWFLTDNKRNEFNAVDKLLYADSSNAEVTSGSHPIDFLSNGFKCRGTGGGNNASGATYIGIAFAENPLVGTNNTPATAR